MSLSNVSTPTHTPYIRANDPSLPSSEDDTLNLPGAPGPHADDHLTNGEVDEGLGKAFGVDHPLFQDLAPEDSYDKNGTYWVSHIFHDQKTELNIQADLPWKTRQKWVNQQSNGETKRELKTIGKMFKADPLSPLSAYCKRYVIGGFGLFTEGYT
jgi:hypothetical protein